MKMPAVLSGLDRWIEHGGSAVDLEAGSRLGVVAHPASVDRQGRHIIDWLHASPAHRVARIFAPEHGLWGHEQDMEPVSESIDDWTGLPVVSLYGTDRESLRPRPVAAGATSSPSNSRKRWKSATSRMRSPRSWAARCRMRATA